MAWGVRFTPRGRKTLKGLHIDAQREIKAALKLLREDPESGKPLTNELFGYFSLRVGRYRVIYSIENELVVVHKAGHRKSVYRESGQDA